MLNALNSGTIPENLNHTFLILISKVQSPRKVTDFKLMNLSNVLNKLIAKVLVNRLKPILLDLVSKTQSAFISERLTTNNVLIAYKTLQYLKLKRSGRMGYMALKLDMSKVYGRVEWDYLESIMEKMGFSNTWSSLISACIRTITYSIVLNGQPHGLIKPSRGLPSIALSLSSSD